ncbi:MAG: hypothetical protein CL424_20145 [Acidimicrobiaceae bacterium]|nr:hypothetical protein [Acidimicrobiaceae bacterium]
MTNPAPAEITTSDQGRTTRRAVLGLGAFGTVMAAARTASAGVGADPAAIAQFAMGAELAAQELYQLADGELWSVMAAHHGAYAERIAGIAGLSARGRNEDIYDGFADAFSSSDPSDAAIELENTLAATHTELLSQDFDLPIVAAVASIAITESRHAATIASLSGADLDTQLVNSAAALAPEA